MPQGQFWAMTGASGSGKSTLLNLIGLLDRTQDGHIKLAGQRVDNLGAHEAAKVRNALIGFVFQSFHLLPRLTAWENVALPLLHRSVQRKLEILRALASSPKLLLADEPTGNLDSESGRMVMTLLRDINRQTGLSILMVTHDQALARQCDHVVHMRDGRIVEGAVN